MRANHTPTGEVNCHCVGIPNVIELFTCGHLSATISSILVLATPGSNLTRRAENLAAQANGEKSDFAIDARVQGKAGKERMETDAFSTKDA
jgi:hypothetical protein